MKSRTKVRISRIWNYPSEIGERWGWNWLIYNPGVFVEFAMVAKRNAPIFTRALQEVFPNADSFNDIGCGTGQFVRCLVQSGKVARGYEYSRVARMFARLVGIEVRDFDVSRDFTKLFDPYADVALSLEVGEHIPSHLSRSFVHAIALAGEQIVFTAAQPGQKGHGHINCQSKQYWESLFIKEGFIKSPTKEKAFIELLSQDSRLSPFLRENLQVFIRV